MFPQVGCDSSDAGVSGGGFLIPPRLVFSSTFTAAWLSCLCAFCLRACPSPPRPRALCSHCSQALVSLLPQTHVALRLLTFRPNSNTSRGNLLVTQILERLREVSIELMKHFDRLDVPWGEVNRLVHGEVAAADACHHGLSGCRARCGRTETPTMKRVCHTQK